MATVKKKPVYGAIAAANPNPTWQNVGQYPGSQYQIPQLQKINPRLDLGIPAPTYQTPNWGALIAGDPDYQGAESEITKMNQMDRGNLRDAIRRAVIESGLSVGQDEDIDAGTLAAAQANQYSSAADIANQLRRGAATSDADLAARGILSSGQFTENRSVLQKSADTARNTLQNALLNTIATGRNQYASTVAERQMQLRQLRETIASRLAQNPGIWGQQQNRVGDVFAPLANASARQMYDTLAGANPSVKAQGFDAWNRQYGSMFGGGGGAAAPVTAAPSTAGGPWGALYAKYGMGVSAGNDANGRPYVIVNGVKRYS